MIGKMKYGYEILPFLLVVVMLLFSCGPNISYAYLTAEDDAENVFTAGIKEVEIDEEFTPRPLEPGVEISKKVHLTNTGNVPVFVRASVIFSDSDMEALCEVLDYDTVKWELHEGYWHYKEVLYPEESTSNLFTGIKIREDANPELLKNFKIYVYAESVLWEGDETVDYISAWKESKRSSNDENE